MHIEHAQDRQAWDAFLKQSSAAPFLQSWTMGEVYRDIGQQPVRLQVLNDAREIVGISQAIVVPAKRGKHLMVQYGPIVRNADALSTLLNTLKDIAQEHGCSFIRLSPFWEEQSPLKQSIDAERGIASPMHLLSEYTWYIPLKEYDRWESLMTEPKSHSQKLTSDDIFMNMRKTSRNLIRRAEREGVTVEASKNPVDDLEIYFKLEEETYKRHHFVPYPHSYIRAQVKHFSKNNQAIVYIAHYNNEPVAASVHMSFGGITSYHHGASTQKYNKIPASYLLQWTAISEALNRGDDIYNFWGIAPRKMNEDGKEEIIDKNHPFGGVTTFKTGFGGKPLPLVHCMDIPLSASYKMTRAFEFVRKWRRGF